MANYSIKELEQLSGVKAHTIRIWEQRYNLINPDRSQTNIRSYNDEHLKKILNVALLIKNGHKISKVASLPPKELHQKVSSLGGQETDNHLIAEKINGLIAAMVDLNEWAFESIFASVAIRIGFEETMLQLIYPLLKKIGVLWGTNRINPAEEHFISNLIRQKIIAAIDGIVINTAPHSTGILYLPEGEFHEIGLLMAHYILKKNGIKVYYLGSNVPFNDLIKIAQKVKPAFVLTFFVTAKPQQLPEVHLSNLKKAIGKTKIYYAGSSSILNVLNPSKSIIYLNSLQSLKEALVAK